MGKIFGLAHTCLFVRVKNDMLRKLYAPNEKSFSSSLAASVTERFFSERHERFFSRNVTTLHLEYQAFSFHAFMTEYNFDIRSCSSFAKNAE